MKIKIKDVDLFLKDNFCGITIGDIVIKPNEIRQYPDVYNDIQQYYDVLAIIQHKKKIKFLVKEGCCPPRLYDSTYFDIVDSKINGDWVYKYFGYNHKLKNKKYMFDFDIDSYIGIKEFIEDPDFLFNVIDEPREARLFCENVLKKYSKVEHKSEF